MTKIHLDTDIGGDMDDVCALAMFSLVTVLSIPLGLLHQLGVIPPERK